MKDYVILADFTCDLSEEIRAEIGMEDYVRGHVCFEDGRELVPTLDWSQISREDFYRALSDKKNRISTSPANIEEYCEIFEAYAKEGRDILSLSLSSKISSTYAFAIKAAERVCASYPDIRILCLDSFRMSGGFGLLTLIAHEMKRAGKSMDEVAGWIEEHKRRVHQMGPIDDLFFIARRGRLTMGKAIMGSFAGVKPMGDCNADGYTTILTKVKGMSKALDVTVEYVKETATNPEEQTILVVHSNREAYANTLKEKIAERLSPKKIYVTDVFSGCGANIGPGMVGVYYLGEEVSEELVAEKQIMNRILGK